VDQRKQQTGVKRSHRTMARECRTRRQEAPVRWATGAISTRRADHGSQHLSCLVSAVWKRRQREASRGAKWPPHVPLNQFPYFLLQFSVCCCPEPIFPSENRAIIKPFLQLSLFSMVQSQTQDPRRHLSESPHRTQQGTSQSEAQIPRTSPKLVNLFYIQSSPSLQGIQLHGGPSSQDLSNQSTSMVCTEIHYLSCWF
jgi:hypothetical protein